MPLEEANINKVLFGLKNVNLNEEEISHAPAPKTPGRKKKTEVILEQKPPSMAPAVPKTPSRKVRKLTPRQIILDDEGSENWCVMGESP